MAKVKHRVGIDGSVDNIFAALTTDIGLAGWWASSAVVNAEIWGVVDLTFDGLAVLKVSVYRNSTRESGKHKMSSRSRSLARL